MIAFTIYDMRWGYEAYQLWMRCRFKPEFRSVQLVAEVDSYKRVMVFDDEHEAALFKLQWSDQLRIERYEGKI